MTHRISPGGSLRIDRRFSGVGRLALASGTTDRKRFQKYNVMLTELHEDGYTDILLGIKDHTWTLQEVYQARRSGRVPYLASELVLSRNELVQAVMAKLDPNRGEGSVSGAKSGAKSGKGGLEKAPIAAAPEMPNPLDPIFPFPPGLPPGEPPVITPPVTGVSFIRPPGNLPTGPPDNRPPVDTIR